MASWNFEHPKQIYPVSWLVRGLNPLGWDEKAISELNETKETNNIRTIR
jgi:hypothetical protein